MEFLGKNPLQNLNQIRNVVFLVNIDDIQNRHQLSQPLALLLVHSFQINGLASVLPEKLVIPADQNALLAIIGRKYISEVVVDSPQLEDLHSKQPPLKRIECLYLVVRERRQQHQIEFLREVVYDLLEVPDEFYLLSIRTEENFFQKDVGLEAFVNLELHRTLLLLSQEHRFVDVFDENVQIIFGLQFLNLELDRQVHLREDFLGQGLHLV